MRLVTPTSEPIIGIVKVFDIHKNYGFISVMYKQDVFFHGKNVLIENLIPNKFVAFKVRKSFKGRGVEAYDINTISFYSNLLWSHRQNFLVSELYILSYVNPIIKAELLTTSELKLLQDFQNRVGEYCDSYDLLMAIKSYNIIVRKSHRYKPGDDDMVRVDYCGDRAFGKYLIPQIGLRDVYMDSILPSYFEEIFYDRGFCSWKDMMESFGDLSPYCKEAVHKTETFRKNAIEKYDRNKHKECIYSFIVEKVKKTIDAQFEMLEKSIKENLVIVYKVGCGYDYSKIDIFDYIL
ncbi:cold shock domain-containing protein [uncultured Bacteroides sp.]|uniref:cold shock domain-containing protein n=1 Tax=uncultured Bacteroides sp. TaxID=162156 RepID=UPI00261E2F33|nr:cold shock domain-containing protein [uncultured Bacteroides sp.]